MARFAGATLARPTRIAPVSSTKNGEEFIGGIPPSSHHRAGTPAHWLAYFNVSDCDLTAGEAKKLGATLYMPPTDFERRRAISVIADPGAAFAIFKAAAQHASA